MNGAALDHRLETYGIDTPCQYWPGRETGGRTWFEWGGYPVPGMAAQPEWDIIQNPKLAKAATPCPDCGMPTKNKYYGRCHPCGATYAAEKAKESALKSAANKREKQTLGIMERRTAKAAKQKEYHARHSAKKALAAAPAAPAPVVETKPVAIAAPVVEEVAAPVVEEVAAPVMTDPEPVMKPAPVTPSATAVAVLGLMSHRRSPRGRR